jgi:hypothetical protein
MVRYDTHAASFTAAAFEAVTFSDIFSKANVGLMNLVGAAFDGQYVYLGPYAQTAGPDARGKVVVRFDAKDPSGLPPTWPRSTSY